MIAVGLGLLGLALVSAAVPDSSADDGSLPVAIGGVVLSLAGFVSLLGALARWAARSRRSVASRALTSVGPPFRVPLDSWFN